ncbi:MAG: ComEC/Rec2 family competence protein [Bacteroidales bacterium]|nr:ComEC/Rec2 family competence protein [Bacteroidales bacterium]
MRGDIEAVGAAGIFTVGTALAASVSLFAGASTVYALCGVSAASACLPLYLFVERRRLTLFWAVLLLLSFSFGLAGEAARWASEPAGLPALASRLSASLRALIDSVPYSDDRVHGLVKALITGDRSGLGGPLKAAFRKSGASHLLALSGMHIGILYLILDRILRPLARSPLAILLKRVLMMSAAILYTMVVGAGPSIVRACLFICLRETAAMLDRPASSLRIFSLALIIRLSFSPSSVSDPGFQLSYLAMAGIFFLYPKLETMYPEKGGGFLLKKIWDGATLSISCQIFTAPAAWYHFHTFPVHFLMTNLLAAPLMTVVMVTALSAISLTAIGICPEWVVKTSEGACRVLIFIIETVSAV